MLSRRRFCEFGILYLLGGRVTDCYAASSLAPDSEEAEDEYLGTKFYQRSNNDILDRALIFELKNIVQVLEINPGFKYLKENNAYAVEKTIVEGTRGTVFLGLALIGALMKEADGGISVAGICAHECAHIHQFNVGLFEKLRNSEGGGITRLELHADFLSGYYLGKRNGSTADQLRKFATTMFKFGDYSYTDPTFHGTPGQRAASMEKGFQVARDNKAIGPASEIGISYVSNL